MTDHNGAARPSDVTDGRIRAREVFEGAGLAAPPVPARLEPGFQEFGDWRFGTRELNPLEMYFATPYAAEAVERDVDDYIAVSHAGHGINSYSINYHLVYGPVAVFAQTGWGGVYMDAEEAVARVGRMFAECAELIAAVDAGADRLPPPPARLIVVESGFRRLGVCRWLERPVGSGQAAADWLAEAEENEGPGIWIKGEPEPDAPFRALAAAVSLLYTAGSRAAPPRGLAPRDITFDIVRP